MKNIFFVVVSVCTAFAAAEPEAFALPSNGPGTPGGSGPFKGGMVRVHQDGTPQGTTSNGTHFVDGASGNVYTHFNCDTKMESASDHFRSTVKNFHDPSYKGGHASRAAFEKRMAAAVPTIDTYFHVITKVASKGTITQKMVADQLVALNTAYQSAGVQFRLKGTDFTANDAWAVAGDSTTMSQLKSALRKGSYAALNVYFHTDLAGGVLGTCSLPSQVQTGMPQSMYSSDGCNIQAGTMPGGTIGGYNKGKTAVHEVGHWMGLLHTFEGYSCTGSGDYISDTSSEATSTDGCPTVKNTCGSADPIHNYMDYSSDACYTSFTPGQITRMTNMWNQYRNGM